MASGDFTYKGVTYNKAGYPISKAPSLTTKNKGSGGGSNKSFIDLVGEQRQSTIETPTASAGITTFTKPTNNNFKQPSGADITQQTIKTAQIGGAENTISSIEKGNIVGDTLNVGRSSFIVEGARRNAESKTKSIWTPSPQQIGEEARSGRVSGKTALNAQSKALGDRITEVATREAQQFAEEEGRKAKQEYQEFFNKENQKLEATFNNLQEKVNNGTISVDEARKQLTQAEANANKRIEEKGNQIDTRTKDRLNSYITNWKNTKGKRYEEDAGIVLRSTDRLSRLSKDNLKDRFTGAFVKGAVAGGAITGILQATGTTIKAGAGAVITGVGAGLSLGKGLVTSGIDVAKGRITKEEYLTASGTRAVEGGVSFLGGFSGAVAGSVLVTGASNLIKTGNLKGIKPQEQKIASRVIEKNGFKLTNTKGKVTETQIKNLKIGSDAKTKLINQLKEGNIVRKTTWKPDTSGLNKAEINALKKFGLKVEVYQVVNTKGNIIETIEVTKVIGKSPLVRITDSDTTIYGGGKGTIKNGRVEMIRVTQTTGRTPEKIIQIGRNPRIIKETSLDFVSAKGNVKYSKGGLLRGETSQATSTSPIRFKADRTDLFTQTTTSNTKILGMRDTTGAILGNNGEKVTLIGARSYKDVWGIGSTKTQSQLFSYSNQISRAFKPLGGGGSQSLTGGGSTNTGGNLVLMGSNTQIITPQVLSPNALNSAQTIISATPTTTSAPLFSTSIGETITKGRTTFNNPQNFNTQLDSLNKQTIKRNDNFLSPVFKGAGSSLGSTTIQQNTPAQLVTIKPITRTKPNQQNQQITKSQNNLFGGLNLNLAPATGLGLGAPFLGRVKVGGGGFGVREKGGTTKKKQYNPSLGSIFINYSVGGNKKSATELSKKTFSGLRLRPLLEFREKKKKKKKKKK